ncbi:MAG: glycosyltransferase [Thermoleophilia bacterium]
MRIVILGLSITSSWRNAHATNYRALTRALAARGHDVLFLERDAPWSAEHRDVPRPVWGQTRLYGSLDELRAGYRSTVRDADAVIVGSRVPDGIAVGEWVVATARGVPVFYDIDTPATLSALARGECAYLTPRLVRAYRVYLSCTGGPTLRRIEDELGSPSARAFHSLVDPGAYPVLDVPRRWDLGHLGSHSPELWPALERLVLEPARRHPSLRCVVAGPDYPDEIAWPQNVQRIETIPPAERPSFYAAQRFTVSITQADSVAAGWSPTAQLFAAAACAVPVISDGWEGVESFFEPGREILIACDAHDVLLALANTTEDARRAIGRRGRERILADHTAGVRAAQLEATLEAALARA